MSFLPATVPALSVSLPALQPHRGVTRHFSTLFEPTEPRMHCEEQHKVEATLPLPPLDVCLQQVCILLFCSGACAYWINVVLMFLINTFMFSIAIWLIEACENLVERVIRILSFDIRVKLQRNQ